MKKTLALAMLISGLTSGSALAQRLLTDTKGQTILISEMEAHYEAQIDALLQDQQATFAVPVQNLRFVGGGMLTYGPVAGGIKMEFGQNTQAGDGEQDFQISAEAGWAIYNKSNQFLGLLAVANAETYFIDNDYNKSQGNQNFGLQLIYISANTTAQLNGLLEDQTTSETVFSKKHYKFCNSTNYGPESCFEGDDIIRKTVITDHQQVALIKASIEQVLFSKSIKLVANGTVYITSEGHLVDARGYVGGKIALYQDTLWLDAGVQFKQNQPKKPEFYIGVTVR